MIEALRRCQRDTDCIWQRTKHWQNQVPPKIAFPLFKLRHEDFLSFSATQLCSEQCPSTEKNYLNPGFDFFSLPPPPLPPVHVFFNRKVAYKLLKAKVHSSAITPCFFRSWWKTGSTGPQSPRKSKGGKNQPQECALPQITALAIAGQPRGGSWRRTRRGYSSKE